MSRLPTTTSGIATLNNNNSNVPTMKRLSRKPSLDLRKRKTISQDVPPMPKSSKSTTIKARSRSFIASDASHFSQPPPPPPPSQQQQQFYNTPRNSITTSPKPLNNSNRNSINNTRQPGTLYLGERVAVDSMGIVGTLRFLGEAEFKEGFWAGIQLDIHGTGKNDGSVKGIRYFSCPANTGLFVLASKVTPLDMGDSDSVRSMSPPRMSSSIAGNGSSRASRYIGMTANQLQQQQQQQQQPTKRKTRTPTTNGVTSINIVRSTSLNTPITSPVTGNRNSLRRSQPMVQSPTPTHYGNRGIPSPAMTPTNHSVQSENADDYYQSILSTDDMMITDTPIPTNISLSKSITTAALNNTTTTTTTNLSSSPPSTSSSSLLESPHERLERVLGEAIAQAPDETVMRLQQLQLRVEVLEAENKFLKLENTQNKTAEQILSRSIVLKRKDGTGDEELFTLEGHKAIVQEIKEKHETEQKTWTTQQQELATAIQRLETKVMELEAEQTSLITERDKSLFDISAIRKEKSLVEQRVHELSSKIAESEAATAAAQAGERLAIEKSKSLQQQLASATNSSAQQQQYFQPGSDSDAMDRQMQLEMEMEEVHEKMSSLRDAARAKDMFLQALSEQVEQHRNAVEEKEREIRRIKADAERSVREKDRVLEELKDVETKWLAHQDCTSKEVFDKLKLEFTTTKEKYTTESKLVEECRNRIHLLQGSVDELKRAGMESIELYESSVEMNRMDREALNASLADERRKVVLLEGQREDLIKAGLDTIEAYEATIEEMKKERAAQFEQQAARRDQLEATIDDLKQEIDQLIKNVETEEKQAILQDVWESERKRLGEQIDQLTQEKQAYEQLKQETEGLKEQAKESERLIKEKSKVEEQLSRLQVDYDEQLASRSKYLDEVRSAVESQKKTEGELRRLAEAKEKLERDLLEQQQQQTITVGGGGDEQQHAIEIETFRSEIEKLQAQNTMLIKQKQQAEQGTQDMTQYQQLIATLKSENKRLSTNYTKLEETSRQSETELLKLMEEVEKLHVQVDQEEEINKIKHKEGTEEDKIALLVQQHQQKLAQLSLDHAIELRKAKEQGETTEKEQKRQIGELNKDISELESLIEGKIFKEADLEEALEKERKQVKKLQLELNDIKEDVVANKVAVTVAPFTTTSSPVKKTSVDYCEICEVAGHDLMSCKAVSLASATKEQQLERPYCENCEEFGLHFTNKCPNQNETF